MHVRRPIGGGTTYWLAFSMSVYLKRRISLSLSLSSFYLLTDMDMCLFILMIISQVPTCASFVNSKDL